MTADPEIYAAYAISDTEEKVMAAYLAKFGEPPAKVEKVIKAIWRGKDWGYWIAGPLPERKGKVFYGEVSKS